ncbi:MAG: hypothetical protein ACYCXF_00205 [Thermoleophilia bacterium]
MIDATLREDGQAPGGSFTIRQKLIIARSMDFLGIDAIEIGRAGVSRGMDEFIAEVRSDQLNAELIVHARVGEQEVEAALETGIGRIAVSAETPGLYLLGESGASLDQASWLVYRAVKEITDSGREVCFLVQDAIRVKKNVLLELCQAATGAGADSVCLSDTAGIALPDELSSVFLFVKSMFPGQSLEARCHDSFGLAVDNVMAAVQAGADCVHVTVNELAARAGITQLRNLAVTLKVQYGIDTVDIHSVNETLRMVSNFSGASLSGPTIAGIQKGGTGV